MKEINEIEKIIEALSATKKDEIIAIVNRLNKTVEKSFKILSEYQDLEDYNIGCKDASGYDSCRNYNRTVYDFEYENGRFVQIMSLSGGSDCWNHYQGNYIDVLNEEELIQILENMVYVLRENVEKIKAAKSSEINYEVRINKILKKNDWKALAKLSKEYCIII